MGDKCISTALVCIGVLGTTPDEGDWTLILSIGTEGFLLVGVLPPLTMSAVSNLVIWEFS